MFKLHCPHSNLCFWRSPLTIASLGVFVLLAGCGDDGPRIVPVSGQVLIDGKPVTRGFIRFIPSNWRASSSAIEPDGRFRLTIRQRGKEIDGAAVGPHQVEVIASEHLSETQTKWHVPKHYAESGTSGLVYEVREPTDRAVIELTWSGGRPFVEGTVSANSEGIQP